MAGRAAPFLFALAFGVPLAGCPQQAEPPAPPVAVTVPSVRGTSAAMTPVAASASSISASSSAHGFAWSPLTRLADDVASLVLAALRGQPLPTALPTEPVEADQLVAYRGEERPQLDTLQFVAFGMDVEMVYEADPAASGRAAPGVEAALLLTRIGLRVVMLRRGSFDVPSPLPSWLTAARGAARGIVATARQGRLGSWVLDEEQSALFGDYWPWVRRELPSEETVHEVEAWLAAAGEPRGYDVDDLVVVARDETRQLFAMTLELAAGSGEPVLGARPLVRVRKVGAVPLP